MAKGNAWKHRNDPPKGYTKRVTEKRELRSTPQYTLDDLLRYTDLPLAEIARRSGLGSQINLYQALRRDCNMSATERRHFLRQEGDEGRFEL